MNTKYSMPQISVQKQGHSHDCKVSMYINKQLERLMGGQHGVLIRQKWKYCGILATPVWCKCIFIHCWMGNNQLPCYIKIWFSNNFCRKFGINFRIYILQGSNVTHTALLSSENNVFKIARHCTGYRLIHSLRNLEQ